MFTECLLYADMVPTSSGSILASPEVRSGTSLHRSLRNKPSPRPILFLLKYPSDCFH